MALFLRRTFPVCNVCYRSFTTATRHQTLHRRKELKEVPEEVPPYPYGPARWYKQADTGLYGGQRIRFGNNVGTKSGTRTRRSWAVNVSRKRLFSKALNRFIQVKVSRRVLRTIDKVGGLDEYLLGEKEKRLKGLGLKGWELRWAIMQTQVMQTKFRRERSALGMEQMEKDVEKIERENREALGLEDVEAGANAADTDKLAALEFQEVMESDAPIELDVDIEEPTDHNVEPAMDEDTGNAVEEIAKASAEDGDVTGSKDAIARHQLRVKVDRNRYMTLTPSGWRVQVPRFPGDQLRRARRDNTPTLEQVIREKLKSAMGVAKDILATHTAIGADSGQDTLSRKQKLEILRHARRALSEQWKTSEPVLETYESKLARYREAMSKGQERSAVVKLRKQRKQKVRSRQIVVQMRRKQRRQARVALRRSSLPMAASTE